MPQWPGSNQVAKWRSIDQVIGDEIMLRVVAALPTWSSSQVRSTGVVDEVVSTHTLTQEGNKENDLSGQNAPAGWYPQDDGRQRYWDGDAWTDHVAPIDGNGASDGAQSQRDADAVWQVKGKPLTGVGAGRYKLTEKHLFFETGALRTDSQQIPIAQVTDVDIKQSMSQKARGVANMFIHVERAQGNETVEVRDVPEFREGQRLINETAHSARLARQRHENTMRYEGVHPGMQGAAAATPAPAAPETGSAEADPMDQLERLGKLRDSGVVTDEEFNQKKAEILSRL